MQEQSAGGEPSIHSRGGPDSDAEATAPPPPSLLLQAPSPPPGAEPVLSDDVAAGPTAMTAPAKKAGAKRSAAKKAPAKTAAKKARAKKTSTKAPVKAAESPAAVTEVAEVAEPAPAPAMPPPRKKAVPRKRAAPGDKTTPRKAAVPKQPIAERGQAEPARTVVAASASPAPGRAAPPVEVAPTRLAEPRQIAVQLLDDPAHAPELLAAAAVRVIGPHAAAWAATVRSAYPAATEEGLTRLATRRFVRLAAAGGLVSAGAGVFAPAAELATAALARAGLVLHIAAAQGYDPGDPARAVELLVLTQVHADENAARDALKAATEALGAPAASQDAPPLSRVAEAGLRLAVPLAAETGGWALLRLASRVVPGARVIAATAGQAAAAERLATRASAYYRRARAS